MCTTVAQKIKATNAANRLRFGSPKLHDLLREKCRSRIKESRKLSFDQSRVLDNDYMSQIVMEEIRELNENIDLQNRIYTEIEQNIYQWTLEGLEEENNHICNERLTFFCPFCEKFELNELPNNPEVIGCCQCRIQIKCVGTPDQFHESIRRIIVKHELLCDEKLSFFPEPICNNSHLSSLCAICMICDYFYEWC